MESIIQKLNRVGQGHLVKFHDELSADQRTQLKNELEQIDWDDFDQVLTRWGGESQFKPPASSIEPLTDIDGTSNSGSEKLERHRAVGMEAIGQGKVAALLLAGGQGTRLGVDYPKGMYDVGLPSHKSLFQLQAERILRLGDQIIWYVMTSGATRDMTQDYFESHEYFGLNKSNVVFFEQDTIPCFDFEGKVLLDEKHRISRSPNGNGGLYEALHKHGIINHMESRGVDYVHAYCVDNVLVRICDPIFMGYCIEKGLDVGAKVVEKRLPDESVGTICKINNQFKVIEYSEIPDHLASKRDQVTGKLIYNAGNICEHFFSVGFLRKPCSLEYHRAIKKIPYICLDTGRRIKPEQANGVKLEKFIFDVFGLTQKFAVWEVVREDEFSPLKNAGTDKDNPTTALKALLRAQDLGILSI